MKATANDVAVNGLARPLLDSSRRKARGKTLMAQSASKKSLARGKPHLSGNKVLFAQVQQAQRAIYFIANVFDANPGATPTMSSSQAHAVIDSKLQVSIFDFCHFNLKL